MRTILRQTVKDACTFRGPRKFVLNSLMIINITASILTMISIAVSVMFGKEFAKDFIVFIYGSAIEDKSMLKAYFLILVFTVYFWSAIYSKHKKFIKSNKGLQELKDFAAPHLWVAIIGLCVFAFLFAQGEFTMTNITLNLFFMILTAYVSLPILMSDRIEIED